MGEERRKLWLYLYPDEPQQQSAIETIEETPQRQRSDFFRDSIVAGIALSKLDKRLPALVAMLLQQDSNIDTLVRILKILFPKLNIDSTENKSTLLAVAWQKRCRDDLQQGTPWSSWFAISEDEYNHHIDHPASNCQVRALWTYDENEQKKDISNQESMSFSDTNINKNSETLTNAKKLFGTSIRRQLVLPTRANYTGRTLQCDIKSRLLLPSLSFSCSFHLSVRTYIRDGSAGLPPPPP